MKKGDGFKKGDSCGEQVSQDQRPCRHQHKENKVEILSLILQERVKRRKRNCLRYLARLKILIVLEEGTYSVPTYLLIHISKVETEVANFRQLDYETFGE